MYTYQPLTLEQAQVCPSALSGLTMAEYLQRRSYARDHYQELQPKRFDWWQTASTSVVVRYIENNGCAFANELCILLCAKSAEHLCGGYHTKVDACWRTRLAWVHGFISDEARKLETQNTLLASRTAWGPERPAAHAVARSTLNTTVWEIVNAASWDTDLPTQVSTYQKLSGLLRALVQSPEPHSLELPVLLARWPVALEQAIKLFRPVVFAPPGT